MTQSLFNEDPGLNNNLSNTAQVAPAELKPVGAKKSKRQIFFDIETTGLKYSDGHRVVEIAALEYLDGKETGRFVHLYFNPEREVPMEVVRIHGLDNNFLDDKPLFRHTIKDLEDFVHGADEVLAHNGNNFDLPFMDYELMANGFNPMTSWKVKKFTDTLKVARAVAGSKKNTLDALCDKYNIDKTKRDLHGAVIDCQLLAEVWFKMTAHINFDKPDVSERQEDIVRLTNLPNLRVVGASEADLNAHEAYIETWKAGSPKAAIVFSEKPSQGLRI